MRTTKFMRCLLVAALAITVTACDDSEKSASASGGKKTESGMTYKSELAKMKSNLKEFRDASSGAMTQAQKKKEN